MILTAMLKESYFVVYPAIYESTGWYFKIKAIQKENRAGVLRFQLYTTDQLRIQVLLLVSG